MPRSEFLKRVMIIRPESAGAPEDAWLSTAYAVLLDDGRMRLEFPKPHLDSEFDVLELRR